MADKNPDEIYGCFDGLEMIYPDKSTEFLIQLTAETMGCDYDEVVSVLAANADPS